MVFANVRMKKGGIEMRRRNPIIPITAVLIAAVISLSGCSKESDEIVISLCRSFDRLLRAGWRRWPERRPDCRRSD